ncbi:MAG: hotdog domain-containing protein [Acidimicrobiales bacterium]
MATEHMALSFLAPGRVGPIEANGKVLHKGRRGAVAEVRVVDQGHEARLMAVALVTVRTLGDKPPCVAEVVSLLQPESRP